MLSLLKNNARLLSKLGTACVLIYLILFLSIIGEATHFTSYFSAVLAFLLILFTIFVFLLPEAGIPPLIPLFF